ncbi:MAG: MFS transporter [Gammaproteobacteria bacterium]|nr:MFS transporter [Gammaproteobacteria bacterium]
MRDYFHNRSFLQQLTTLGSMYAGYGAMMICRQMVTILSPALLADESLNFTVKDTGDILAYGTVGAMVGKLIWGPLADKIGGRFAFLAGIVLTALLVVTFGLSHNVVAFTVCSALLYCTKSSGWPGMTKIVGQWYVPRQYGRVWSILSTSSRASVVLGTVAFGWLLAFFHWRTVAFLSAAMALLVYAVCRFFLYDKPTDSHFMEDDKESATALAAKQQHPLDGTSLWTGLWEFARSSRVWFVFLMLMGLTSSMAFLDFLPAYLMESFQLTPSQASMASSYMPLGSLIGLIASIVLYDRFSKKQLRTVLTTALILATLCIVSLQFLPQLDVSLTWKFRIANGLILLFGVLTSPAYYIPMSIFSIEFGGPHSATLVCLIDMSGFAASASFGFMGGRLAASAGGWSSFMALLIIIGVVATISTWLFMNGEYRAASRANATLKP